MVLWPNDGKHSTKLRKWSERHEQTNNLMELWSLQKTPVNNWRKGSKLLFSSPAFCSRLRARCCLRRRRTSSGLDKVRVNVESGTASGTDPLVGISPLVDFFFFFLEPDDQRRAKLRFGWPSAVWSSRWLERCLPIPLGNAPGCFWSNMHSNTADKVGRTWKQF